MFSPGSEIFIVGIAPDGSRTAYRLHPETVQLQIKTDYPDIYALSPVVLQHSPKHFVEVSGVLADGRAWTPGTPMKEML